MLSTITRGTFFSYGFRTFFLSGALWAATSMLLWVIWLSGTSAIRLPYNGFAWHAHELLIGYGSAIIAGFLLTAIPNWTRRPPVQGAMLMILWLTWLAGRLAVLLADHIGQLTAAVIDVAFLILLVAVISREIIAGRNFRNLRIALLVGLIALSNLAYHAEYALRQDPAYSLRAVIALFVILMSVIGGRIIPAFTRNWLLKTGQTTRLPAPFNLIDIAALGLTVVTLGVWTAAPMKAAVGYLFMITAVLQLLRLTRWCGWQTVREPLVLILHIGYLFISMGFLLTGLSIIAPATIASPLALHAWTTGALGTLTLAVMTRATRGHAGFPLTATRGTQVIYMLIVAAALTRLAPTVLPDLSAQLHLLASVAWIAAYVLFAAIYGKMLTSRSPAVT